MRVRIAIDGREHLVEEGRDLLTTCLSEGIDLPHFCWHGALGSVGACRLCAVRVHDGPDDAAGRIDMACMVPAAEGQRVAVADGEAATFRARVIEWLMANHPHDCAVCEEGGACHLQDMTVLVGHHRRRYRFSKRTHRNQWLGPLLTHEMNRCIACYRCTRFYRGYAGGRDLDVFGAHDRVYFGRAEDGVLESPFAGNLAEVCPTGVFNDRGWSRGYARKWDMMASPSVCPHCSVGCNLFLAERHGVVRRVQNRYHGAINGHFLCDRGRFGPLFVSSSARLVAPLVDGAGADEADAVAAARAAIAEGAVGIGSPRASLEGNFALRRLVGPDRFFAGVTDGQARLHRRMAAILSAGPGRIATLSDMERADAVLVLGEDLTGTAPRAALALRQTARNAARALAAEKGVPSWLDNAVRYAGEGRPTPFILAASVPDPLEAVATAVVLRPPDGIAAFGRAVAAALRGEDAPDEARAAADALSRAAAPLVVAGSGQCHAATVEAAAEVAAALGDKAMIALFPAEANAIGLALTGADGLEGAVARLEAGEAATAVIIENNLFERADAALVERLFAAARTVVALDAIATRTTERAHVALPVASIAEAAGTFVNHEGRAQRFFAAVPDGPPAAWRQIAALAPAPFGWERLDHVLAAMAADLPALAGAADAAPGAAFRTPLGAVARAPRPFSGRTASDEAGRVAPGSAPDPDSPLAFSMEGARGRMPPPALLVGYEVPHLHSASAVYRFEATPGGPLAGGDPGVRLLAPGVASTPPAADDPPGEGDADGLLSLAAHDPFGAGETDRASPLLAERAPPPALTLHPDDAAALGLAPGDRPRIGQAVAPVRLDERIPRGHLAIGTGLLPRGPARRVRPERVP